jgi:uncharacterized cupin superfamily protein
MEPKSMISMIVKKIRHCFSNQTEHIHQMLEILKREATNHITISSLATWVAREASLFSTLGWMSIYLHND